MVSRDNLRVLYLETFSQYFVTLSYKSLSLGRVTFFLNL